MSAASDDESLKSEDGPQPVNGANGTFNPMKKSSILHPSLVLRNGEDIPHPDALGFEEELPGWHGYVEWEKYPEKKTRAKELMKKFTFPSVGSTFFPLLSRTDRVGARISTCTAAEDESDSRRSEMEAIPLCIWEGVEGCSG